MKLSTLMLSILALIGCVFSIGVLLGALALNADESKHAYRSKTSNNHDLYVDGPDPALGIGHGIPKLPGAQVNGVKKPTPLQQPRDLNTATNTKPIPTVPVTPQKQSLLSSKIKQLNPSDPTNNNVAAAAAAVLPPTSNSNPSNPTIMQHGKVHREYSLRLDGENWMDVINTLDSMDSSDAVDLSFTAWIYLDAKDKGNHMKTIFANRVAGCDINSDRYGFAFYVNTWQTNDRALKVDIGTNAEGCSSLATREGVIPCKFFLMLLFLVHWFTGSLYRF